jgi:hypothetical protein
VGHHHTPFFRRHDLADGVPCAHPAEARNPVLIESERLNAADVCALLGKRRNGRPVHPATISKWYTVGLRGIRLRVERQGGTVYTCREWLDQFFQELTATPQRCGRPAMAGLRRDRSREVTHA